MGKAPKSRGFTLIELIVVVALLSIMLVISIPRFHNVLIADSQGKTSRWLIGTTKTLRDSALRQQKRYALHIDMDAGVLWTSDASMTEEAVLEAASSGYRLPDDTRVADVEFPVEGKVSTGRIDIFFHPQGYSDQALIHLSNQDSVTLTYAIEPFLSEIEIYETYKSYHE
jgi:prepilin-type N-terminal cleavage/methylation domain-containing protein